MFPWAIFLCPPPKKKKKQSKKPTAKQNTLSILTLCFSLVGVGKLMGHCAYAAPSVNWLLCPVSVASVLFLSKFTLSCSYLYATYT